MADLRIVDAPEIPTEDITGEEKLPTGGSGNYSISLDSLADYTKTKKDLADNTSVDSKVSGVRQELNTHIEDLLNPHQVTKGQIGLGNVDNTADADKPVSNSTQAAIINAVAPKADKTYVDNQLTLKANKVDVYTKLETYTKQESNDLVKNSISTALTPVNSSLDLAKRGVVNRYDSSLTYNSGERVVLANGDIVKSTVDGNTNDPNVDMTGWLFVSKNKADTVISIAALRDFHPEYNGQLVETVSYHAFTNTGASRYRWNPSGDSLDDGFARIRTSKASGCFEIIEQDEYSLSQLGAQPNQIIDDYISTFISSATTYAISRNLVIDAENYEVTENLSNYINLLRIRGLGAQSKLKYVGSDGGVLVKAINSAGATSALSTVGLSDIAIDMNFVEGATALQVIYATNESRFENIQIINIGINGCGVDTSKLWYTFFDNIRVSNPSGFKQGIGLRVRSITGDALSQVNGISFNGFRIGRMDIGVLFDSTSAAHYSLGLFGVIEACNIGVKHIGTLGVVRMDTFIHYEANTTNVEWGVAGQNTSTVGLINWNGYSNEGDFRFNQNHHDVKIRTVPSTASVYMTGNARVAWFGEATANLDQVNYPDTSIPLIDFKEKTLSIGRKESTQAYSLADMGYGKQYSHRYNHASGAIGAIDLLKYSRIVSDKYFAKVEFIGLRHSDGASRTFTGFAVRRTTTQWQFIKQFGNDFDASFTLSISNGVITHTGTVDLDVCVLITPC